MNTTIRLINEEAKYFDEYYMSGKISPEIEQYLRDGLIFHVYSPNDIPLDRFAIFAKLVVWVTSNDNNISDIYIKSCKFTSDYFTDGQVIVDVKKHIYLKEQKIKNSVFFREYAGLLNKSFIDNELIKIISTSDVNKKRNKNITVEVSVEYIKDGEIITTVVPTKLVLRTYKSFVFWDRLMSV
ncbi:MAG: hypothetical protein LBS37_05680 [Treponema sp.]|jgi:hypothetical protein|nr:hypothetical protein [Treponema sp.]